MFLEWRNDVIFRTSLQILLREVIALYTLVHNFYFAVSKTWKLLWWVKKRDKWMITWKKLVNRMGWGKVSSLEKLCATTITKFIISLFTCPNKKFFWPIRAFWKLFNCTDWLDKSRSSKKPDMTVNRLNEAHYVWRFKELSKNLRRKFFNLRIAVNVRKG